MIGQRLHSPETPLNRPQAGPSEPSDEARARLSLLLHVDIVPVVPSFHPAEPRGEEWDMCGTSCHRLLAPRTSVPTSPG